MNERRQMLLKIQEDCSKLKLTNPILAGDWNCVQFEIDKRKIVNNLIDLHCNYGLDNIVDLTSFNDTLGLSDWWRDKHREEKTYTIHTHTLVQLIALLNQSETS